MKHHLILILLLIGGVLTAQVKPDILPEDFTPEGGATCVFCKPGVRNKSRSKGLEFSYTYIDRGTFKDEESGIIEPYTKFRAWQRFEIDLKAPLVNRDSFKVLLGYKYGTEQFNLNQIGNDYTETFESLDESTLKSNNISLIISRPLNERRYLAFRFRYTSNGNYSSFFDFGSRYAIWKGLALYGFKKHEDFEWGIGLNVSKSFRRTNIVPFLLLNKTFISNWGIEAALPGYIFGRYNFSSKTIVLFGLEYGSDSYRMDVFTKNGSRLDYALNHSELLGLLRLEKRVAPWVWCNIRAGYQVNFSTDFESKSQGTDAFMVDPTGAPYLEIGIFISPPDNFR